MIPQALTPTELAAHCRRVAEVGGGKTYVYASCTSDGGVSVSVYTDSLMRVGKWFSAGGWPEMLAEAEAYARELWVQQHAADLEVESWSAQPAPAAEAA